jgi:Response regulator containing CheY-like receiver and SARP domains
MIKAVIVDDELPSLGRLSKLLEDSGLAEIYAKFTSPLEALEYLKENVADAVFLDIEMPDMDGIELAGRIVDLRENISVVFVTAYNQYAVEAFRLNALDYLMKPVSAERLGETLERISKRKPANYAGKVSVSCFGRFRVKAGESEVRFRTEKAEELLAFLIDRRKSYVSRSEIIDTLWDEFDGDKALIHFNTTLFYVKKALINYGIRLPISYDRGGYRMDASGISCDYLKFCSFTENAGTPLRKNISDFEDTAGLYVDEYLSGLEYGWAAGKRVLIFDEYIRLLVKIADYYKKEGDFDTSAKWLKAGLLMEPLHRELNFRIIEAMLLLSEHIMASKYYDTYKNGLKERFGLEPDQAFKKLFEIK